MATFTSSFILSPRKFQSRKSPSFPPSPKNRQWNPWWNFMLIHFLIFTTSTMDFHPLLSTTLHFPYISIVHPTPDDSSIIQGTFKQATFVTHTSSPPIQPYPTLPPPDVSTHGLLYSWHRWWARYCEDIGLQICFRRAQDNRHLGEGSPRWRRTPTGN